MDPLAALLVSFVAVTVVTFGAGFVVLRLWPSIRAERLEAPVVTDPGRSILRWDAEPSAAWRRVVERLGRALRPKDATKLSRSHRQLVWAGYTNPRAVGLFFGAKAVLGLVFAASYTLYGMWVQRAMPNVLMMSMILAVIGLFLPDYWLRRRIRARERRTVNALPDVMDLLVVCVEAGMGFDAAVARIAEQPEGRGSPLHEDLLRMHLEMRAGRPREEAMKALAERSPSTELRALVGAFIQAERLGTPLGKTLRIHSDSGRVQRRHRAEERAHLAPLKMIFPTVLFLMPAFFLVAMAPSLLGISEILGKLNGR